MKLLTVNFLTCAVKSCKSSLSTTPSITTTTTSTTAIPTPSTNTAAAGEAVSDHEQQQQPSTVPPQNQLQPNSPFPLHFKDAVLERTDMAFNPLFIRNILPRVNWEALKVTATELGVLDALPEKNPVDDDEESSGSSGGGDHPSDHVQNADEMDIDDDEKKKNNNNNNNNNGKDEKDKVLRRLHGILLETTVTEGKLVCGRCGFEYPIKEGVANFLLPPHLV